MRRIPRWLALFLVALLLGPIGFCLGWAGGDKNNAAAEPTGGYPMNVSINGAYQNGITVRTNAKSSYQAGEEVKIVVLLKNKATAKGTHTVNVIFKYAGKEQQSYRIEKEVQAGDTNFSPRVLPAFPMPSEAVDVEITHTYATQVKQKPLTLGNLNNMTYGDEPQTLGASGGSTRKDRFEVISGPARIVGRKSPFKLKCTGAGPVTVRAYQNETTDYFPVYSDPVTITVSPKPLTIKGLTSGDKVYDGTRNAVPSGNGTLDGIINSDDVTLNSGSAEFASSDAGNGIMINFSGYSLSGSKSGNYSLTQPDSVYANITPAAADIIGIAADASLPGTVVTDQILPGITVAGVNGEVFTGTWSYTVPAMGATAPATFTPTGGTAKAGNYKSPITANLTFSGATYNIAKPAAVSANGITATAEVESTKRSGDSVKVKVTLSGTAESQGIHTTGLTSAQAGTITAPAIVTKSTAAGQSLTDNYIFSFQMPAQAVDDLTVTHTFSAQTVDQVSITPAAHTLTSPGETLQLSAAVTGTAGIAQTVAWSSSNGEVATVSNTGLVTAIASGTATITAKSKVDNSKTGTAVITVNIPGSTQTVDKVSITPKTATLTTVGATLQLNAEVTGTAGVDPTVVWSSDNTAVATISSTGLVTALANGTAAITATSTIDDSKEDAAAITVNISAPPPSSGSNGGSPAATSPAGLMKSTDSSNAARITAAELNQAKGLTVKGKGASLIFSQEGLNAMGIKSSVEVTVNPVQTEGLSEAARAIIGNRPVFNIKVIADGQAVTNTGQLSLEIPYTPKAGEDTSKLAAFYIADDGAITQMEGSYYDAAKKAIVFSTTHLSVYAIGIKGGEVKPDVAKKFTDVADGHWAEKAVYYLAGRGILSGKTAAEFAPEDNITRAEFVTILAKINGNTPPPGSSPFRDADAQAWYAPYVAWASQTGIAGGYNGQFRPDDLICRQDMAVMLSNYANKTAQCQLPAKNDSAVYADDKTIADYARKAVYTMRQAGIISGREGNALAPQAVATRAEAAQMVAAMLQNMQK